MSRCLSRTAGTASATLAIESIRRIRATVLSQSIFVGLCDVMCKLSVKNLVRRECSGYKLEKIRSFWR